MSWRRPITATCSLRSALAGGRPGPGRSPARRLTRDRAGAARPASPRAAGRRLNGLVALGPTGSTRGSGVEAEGRPRRDIELAVEANRSRAGSCAAPSLSQGPTGRRRYRERRTPARAGVARSQHEVGRPPPAGGRPRRGPPDAVASGRRRPRPAARARRYRLAGPRTGMCGLTRPPGGAQPRAARRVTCALRRGPRRRGPAEVLARSLHRAAGVTAGEAPPTTPSPVITPLPVPCRTGCDQAAAAPRRHYDEIAVEVLSGPPPHPGLTPGRDGRERPPRA